MDCTISPQNALLIDKILKSVRTSTMSIDTTSRILFQLISLDKTLVLDLSFEETFFSELQLKKKLVTIPKQKFYMKRMKSLRIIHTEYMLTFEYIFDMYILRRNVFYNQPSLSTVKFLPAYSGEVCSSILMEAFKEINGESIIFKVSDGTGSITTKGTSIRFPLRSNGEFSVNGIGSNLKSMFDISGLFIQTIINYEASGSPLNLIFVGAEVKASFFTAVNEE